MDDKKAINLTTTERWLIASVLFLLSFVLGVWGYLATGVIGLDNFFFAVYYTFQLVFIDPPSVFYQEPNWQLLVASVVLPLFPAVAILKLLARIFGVQFSLWGAYLRPYKHVFLGAGKLSTSVIDALNTNGDKRILAIDIDGEKMTCNYLRKMQKVKLLEHNVNERKFLKALRLHRADTIYVFTGDDRCNIEIAEKISEIILHDRRGERPVRMIVNIESLLMRDLISDSRLFKQMRAAGIDITWLSAQQQAAQEIVGRYPPSNELKKCVHVGILGDGPLVNGVVGQLIKQTLIDFTGDEHEARLDITLFSQSDTLYRELLSDYPVLAADASAMEYGGLAPLAHVRHHATSGAGLLPRDLRQLERPLDAVYILEKEDHRCVHSAFSTAQAFLTQFTNVKLLPTIVVGLLGDQYRDIKDFYYSLGNNHKQIFESMSWFHRLSDSFDQRESYPGETVDLLGRAISDFYYREFYLRGSDWSSHLPAGQWPVVGNCKCEGPPPKIEAQDLENNWLGKSEAFRDSDRQSGYHILTKLRFLGYVMERRVVLERLHFHLTELMNDLFLGMRAVVGRHTCFTNKKSYLEAGLAKERNNIETLLETVLIAAPEGLTDKLVEVIKQHFQPLIESIDRKVSKEAFDETTAAAAEAVWNALNEFFDSGPGVIHKAINDSLEHNIEALASLEHRRFVNERIIDGWLCDVLIKDAALIQGKRPRPRKNYKLNHTIVDNETLAELDAITKSNEKSKDDGIVRCVKNALSNKDLMEKFIVYRMPVKSQDAAKDSTNEQSC